jgi:hypothetical protein
VNQKEVTYNYQGIVSNNFKSALRFAVGHLGVPFVKSLLKFVPGIDNAIYSKHATEEFFVEVVPSFLGFFTAHWEIREKLVRTLLETGVKVRSMHAPYVDDGKTYQPPRKTYLDNVLDLTNYSSQTWLCLYSHINLYEMLAPKSLDKVLIVHPLAANPYKTEGEIISSIVKNVKKVLPVLRDQNVKLVIENMPWMKKKHERYTTLMGDAIFFEKLMNEISDSHVGVILDWGHANSYARYMFDHGINHPEHEFTVESLQEFAYQNYFIKKLKEKIYYAHLHFNEAHVLDSKPPFYAKNYDTHEDLTLLSESEYTYYKKNVQNLQSSPNLVGMTIECIPSYFNRAKRIQKYRDSIEILNSMLQSKS